MRNMHVWPYSVSKEIVWFSDLCAGGLYTYDCKSEEVHCIIKPDVLFHHGIFRVGALTCWKSFVFIFSDKLDGVHIVYDRTKNEIKKMGGLKEEGVDTVHRAIVVGEILYLIPLRIRDYIYEINLHIWNKAGDSFKFVRRRIGKNLTMRTWLPKCEEQLLYIPEFGGKRVFCVAEDKLKVIELDIPSQLNTIGVWGEELWAVPSYGNYIFQMSLEGKMQGKVEIPGGCTKDGKSDVWEIISEDEFLIFVHWRAPKIDIYNKKSKKAVQIDNSFFELSSERDIDDGFYYLPHVMWKNVIQFFPSKCNFLEIELSNMEYRLKKFGFPEEILDKEWDDWCRTVRKYRYGQKVLLREGDEIKLKSFLKYICDESFLGEIYDNRNSIGVKIYQHFLNKV